MSKQATDKATVDTVAGGVIVAPMPAPESQAFSVQLGDALEKAMESGDLKLAPVVAEPEAPKADALNLYATVSVDGAKTDSIACSAAHRITGTMIVALPRANGGLRRWASRWRFAPPQFDGKGKRLLGRPSISPVCKVRCTCSACGHALVEFADIVGAMARKQGGKFMCPACGKAEMTKIKLNTVCRGGTQDSGHDVEFDDIMSGNTYAKEEFDSIKAMHEHGYDESSKLLLPGLWVCYKKAPIEFTPTDSLSAQIVAKAAARQDPLQAVPFDRVIKHHMQEHESDIVPHMGLVLETIGGGGWADIDVLEGRQMSAWTQRWVTLPPPRSAQRAPELFL